MVLLGQDVLSKASRRNKSLRKWLTDWAVTVVNIRWESIRDVRRSHPSADGVSLSSGTVVTIFNVKGNEYRLLAWIDYETQMIEVLEIITHAEYDKKLWKARY
jgi:mRNA interferase HigB